MSRPSKRLKPIFAVNVVDRRKALGWNAHKLAEAANIPYPTLRDIEAGINAGREETKAAIAKALNCSVSDLYKEPSLADLPEMPGGITEAIAILQAFEKCHDVRKAFVLALIFHDASWLEPLRLSAPQLRALRALVTEL